MLENQSRNTTDGVRILVPFLGGILAVAAIMLISVKTAMISISVKPPSFRFITPRMENLGIYQFIW